MTKRTLTKLPDAASPLKLGAEIASSGEGVIRECISHPHLVAKIYHPVGEAELDRKNRKLVAMIGMTDLREHNRLAWPQQRLYRNGELAGFLMPRMEGISLVPLSAEISRKTYLPHWIPAHVARVIHDIASLCAILERYSVFVTDVSLTNFLTDPTDGRTSIIDTDSLQIPTDREVFGSNVYTADYAAPKVLKDLALLGHIGSAQARFTISLLFFQLYTQGFPYQVLEHSNLDPAQQIIAGRHFLGGKGVATGTTPAPIFNRYRTLPPLIAWLFKQTFIEGHQDPSVRPTFSKWRSAAEAHYQSLRNP